MSDMWILEEGAHRLGLELTSTQVEQFRCYYQELLDWNRKVNLTSITQWHQVQRVHFLDSLTVGVGMSEEVREGGCLVDVGSGAGFPGLPMKIAFPGLNVTLVESVGKKARFLEHMVGVLDLHQVSVCAGRAEILAHEQEYRGVYDIAVARALSPLPAVLEMTLPFCRDGGVVVIQKKGDIAGEVQRSARALQLLGGHLRGVYPVSVLGLEDGRVLVLIEKVGSTPAVYPRRPGMAEKRPL